jgi:hypothetical protein
MSYENLDTQDQEIIKAIQSEVSDEAIIESFGVDQAKVDQLKGAIANEALEEAPVEAPAEEVVEAPVENTEVADEEVAPEAGVVADEANSSEPAELEPADTVGGNPTASSTL